MKASTDGWDEAIHVMISIVDRVALGYGGESLALFRMFLMVKLVLTKCLLLRHREMELRGLRCACSFDGSAPAQSSIYSRSDQRIQSLYIVCSAPASIFTRYVVRL
jgi:hypothetical protein